MFKWGRKWKFKFRHRNRLILGSKPSMPKEVLYAETGTEPLTDRRTWLSTRFLINLSHNPSNLTYQTRRQRTSYTPLRSGFRDAALASILLRKYQICKLGLIQTPVWVGIQWVSCELLFSSVCRLQQSVPQYYPVILVSILEYCPLVRFVSRFIQCWRVKLSLGNLQNWFWLWASLLCTGCY